MRSLLGRFRRPISRSQLEKIGTIVLDGDGRTLDLDFTTMSNTVNLTDRGVSFSRAGTATFINAIGLLQDASTNEARFEYSSTGAPLGLLLEGAATNLLNFSETFATAGGTNNNWVDSNITRNSTNNTDPRGTPTALRVTASAANATIISSTAIGTAFFRTFSIWLRRVSGTGNIEYTTNNGGAWATQAITTSWVRYTFTATNGSQQVGIRIATSGDSIELWGAQLEFNTTSSSYIATGSSQASRVRDVVTISGSSFASIFSGASSGWSAFLQCTPRLVGLVTGSNNTRFGGLFSCVRQSSIISAPRSGAYVFMYNNPTAVVSVPAVYTMAWSISNGSAAVSETYTPANQSFNVERKLALSFTNGAQLFSTNGATQTNRTVVITTYDMDVMAIGHQGASSDVGQSEMSCHYKRLTFWPFTQTQVALNALTT